MIVSQENERDLLWYKDAVIYELHVKSFFDSNDDGIGDFPGVIQKLDYLQDLGITAIWLLPFYPSPLLDDGYDIADYFNINPDYGTLGDFKRLLREAHKRDIRVITELVINHTSDQHKWFQRARRAKPGSVWRDFYVWSDTTDRYDEARIIFTDFESSNWAWDPVAEAYYWHRFYSHQPDLNFDNPRVKKEILRVLDFWFTMGVDGMRLDAVPYLIERDDTNCENLPETHRILKELRAYLDRKYPGRMLLAEANQWPQDASTYFGAGDECHMAFHFPIMPRLFMGLRMEDRFPVIDMLEQSLDIPDACQWAMFLRNHDELTLEMVTDQERDYMYKAYAQDPRRINVGIRRRLAPLLENNRRQIELLNSLLLALPGTPIVYYGDEIGMGDNYFLGDRDGVRTPMQWSPDRNAGFSKVNAHRLYLPVIIDSEYHFTTVNVENQIRNPSSLYWFMRRLLSIRRSSQAFGRGALVFLQSDNTKVLTFLRTHQEETILVVANLSRYCQSVNIDLSDYPGYSVVELFSDNEFSSIEESPYHMTLAPHSFFWFMLKAPLACDTVSPDEWPQLVCQASWSRIMGSRAEAMILDSVRTYLKRVRWFGGKGRRLRRLRIVDHLTLSMTGHPPVHQLRLEATYADAPKEEYLLPLGFAGSDSQIPIIKEVPEAIIAQIQLKEGEGILYDAAYSETFQNALIEMIAKKRSRKLGRGRLKASRGPVFSRVMDGKTLPFSSRVLKTEQSNTSVVYDDVFFLKLYRRVEEGINPDVQLTRYLTEDTGFTHLPAFAGSLEWQYACGGAMTMGLLLQFIPNETDAWSYTLDAVKRSYSWALTQKDRLDQLPEIPRGCLQVDENAVPDAVQVFIDPIFLEMVVLLGRRTAEMHRALASLSRTPDVTPEPFSLLYQKSLYQSIRALIIKVFGDLDGKQTTWTAPLQASIKAILAARKAMFDRLRRITEKRINTSKIRTHGDYHLGQVLFTGKDFAIIDFEGEPMRPLTERHLNQSALKDVAGMIRSFHYAAHGSLLLGIGPQQTDVDYLNHWADVWYMYVSGMFLRSYLATAGTDTFIPQNIKDVGVLLEAFVLEKAVYELNYELNNRPDWLTIPIRGIEHILKGRF